MVNFVKVVAIQGNVVQESKSGDTKLLSGSVKLPLNTKLILSDDSIVVIQLANGRMIKIKAKDLIDFNGELQLDSQFFQTLVDEKLSDLDKLESFATDYQNISETVDSNIIRLDDGRVFQRVGKDYVEVAADSFADSDGGGNRFLQLARIGDESVSDGISPLSLNRVDSNLSNIAVVTPVTNRFLIPTDDHQNLFNINNNLNRPPQAIDDLYETKPNTPIVLNPLNQDYDLDGKDIQITSINGQPNLPNTEFDVPNGKVVIDHKGVITFIPDFGFTGIVEFPYVIQDERGATATAHEIITIKPIDSISLVVVSEEGLVGANPDNGGNTDTTNNSAENGKIIVGDIASYTGLTYQLTDIPSEKITSNGQPVTWILESTNNTIIGSANGINVIKLELDRLTGEYTVNLYGSVDHKNEKEEDILTFNVPYKVTDSQNGFVDGKISVTIEDDSPIASDDIPTDVNNVEIILAEDGLSTAEGNVLNNDKAGADHHAQVVSVEYTDPNYSVQKLDDGVQIVETPYGQLKIFKDGTYTYTLDNTKITVQQLTDKDVVKEVFSYTMRDADGDESTAELTITLNGKNDPLEIGTEALAVVSEEGLVDGIPDNEGITDSTDSRTSNGKILVKNDMEKPGVVYSYTYALTGTPDKAITSNGQPVVWEINAAKDTVVGSANGIQVIELNLNGNSGEYTVTLHAPIDHPEQAYEDTLDFYVPYLVTDQDGQFTNNSIRVVIEDDSPIASDDIPTNVNNVEIILAEDGLSTAEGNVLNNDKAGADGGATVITVGSQLLNNAEIVVAGKYGDVTIKPNGEYTYTLNDEAQKLSKDQKFTEVFTYTIKDLDGDESTATLSINITGQNDVPVIETEAKVVVSEEGLVNANQDVTGNTDTTNEKQATGQIVASDVDQDAILTYTLTGIPATNLQTPLKSNGQLVVWSLDKATNTVTGSANGSKVIDLKLNKETGEYTVTLHGPVDHADSKTEDTLSFNIPYKVQDQHGGKAESVINVTVEDDSPIASNDVNHIVEDASPIIGNVLDNDLVGADAGATVTQENGEPLQNSLNIILGKYGTLELKADGTYTYTLNTEAEKLNIDETVTENFSYTMRDADGDLSKANLGITITGQNDVPVIKTEAKVVVSEEGLANSNPDKIGNTDTTDNKIVVGQIIASDVDQVETLTYTLTGIPATNLQTPLKSNGQLVVWSLDKATNTVTGSVNGSKVIELKLESQTGAYTVTLHGPVDHADSKTEDTLSFNIPYKVQDQYGEKAESVINVTVEDDSPRLVKNGTTLILDEKYLEFGSEPEPSRNTAKGTVEVAWGADNGSQKDAKFTETTKLDLENWAKNNTSPFEVTISQDGHTLIAKDGDKELFEVTLKIDADGAVEYEVILKNALDHKALEELNLPFNGLKITDADGDFVSGSFDVTIKDDNPNSSNTKFIEVNEDLYVPLDEKPTNTFNTNADATGVNTTIDGGTKTPNGTAVVNSNGTITYTPDANFSGTDKFTYTTKKDDGTQVTYTVEVVVNPISNDPPTLTTGTEILCTPEDTKIELGLKAPQIADNTDQNDAKVGDQPERLGVITLTLSGLGTTTVTTGNSGKNAGAILVDANGNPLKLDDSGDYKIVLVDDAGNVLSMHHSDLPLTNVNYLTKEQYEKIQAQPGENRHENFEVKVEVTSYEVDANGKIDDGAIGTGSTLSDQSDDQTGIGATSSETIKVTVQAVTDNVALTFDTSVVENTAEFVSGSQNKQDIKTIDYTVKYDETKPTPEANVELSEDYSFSLKDITHINFNDLDGSEKRSITIKNPADSGGDIRVFNGSIWEIVKPGSSIQIETKDGLASQTGNEDSFNDIKISGAENQSQKITGIEITIKTVDSDSDGAECGEPVPEKDLTDNTIILNLDVKPLAGDVVIANVETTEDTAVNFLKNLTVTDKSQVGENATHSDGEVINEVSFDVPKDWKVIAPTQSVGWTVQGDGITGKYTITFGDSLTQTERENILSKFEILPPAHSSRDLREENSNELKVTVKTTDSKDGVSSEQNAKELNLEIKVTPVAEKLVQKGDSTGGNLHTDWEPTDTDKSATNANEDATANKDDAEAAKSTDDLAMNGDHVYSYQANLDAFNFTYDPSIANFDPSVVYPPNNISFDVFKKDNAFAFEGEPFYINQDKFDLSEGWFNEDGKGITLGGGTLDTNGRKEETYAKLTAFTGDKITEVTEASFEYLNADKIWQSAEVINGHVVVPMEFLDSVRVNLPNVYDEGLFAVKVEALTVDYDEDDNSRVFDVSGVAWLTNIIVLPTASDVTLQVNQREVMDEDSTKELFIRTQSEDPKEKFIVNIEGLPSGSALTLDGHTFDTNKADSWTLSKDGVEYQLVEINGAYSLTISGLNAGEIKPLYTPPLHSNTNGINTDLTVTAKTIDEKNGFISIGEQKDLPINISVIGVPDKPIVELNSDFVWIENDVDKQDENSINSASKDDVANVIDLDKFIKNITMGEANAVGDTSETLSLKISGLPNDFELIDANGQPIETLLGGSGADRIWLIEQTDINSIKIKTPVNYSGEQSFNIQPIVTENDGRATAYDKEEVKFTILPSAEISLVDTSTHLWEDEKEGKLGQLNLSPMIINGDSQNEEIVAIRLQAEQVSNQNIILYSDAEGKNELILNADGYYYLDPKVPVYVRGPANFSGEKIIDIEYIAKDWYLDAEGKKVEGYLGSIENGVWSAPMKIEHKLNFAPITDDATLSIKGESSFTLTSAKEITISLDISKNVDESSKKALDSTTNNEIDYDFNINDGGEHINKYVITNVPDGVIVQGAMYVGYGKWVLKAEAGFEKQLSKDIKFTVTDYANGNLTDHPIRIDVFTQDKNATEKHVSVDWKLSTEFGNKLGPSLDIDHKHEDISFIATEDTSFTVDQLLDVKSFNFGSSNTLDVVITLKGLSHNLTLQGSGLVSEQVIENGQLVTIWYKKIKDTTSANFEAELEKALQEIEVLMLKDSNTNNLDEQSKLDISISLLSKDGASTSSSVSKEFDIIPVTDEAKISITTTSTVVGELEILPIEMIVTNSGDQAVDWSIVGDIVYFTVSSELMGTLLYEKDGTAVKYEIVDGQRVYEIKGVQPNSPIKFQYQLDDVSKGAIGNFELNAWLKNQENNAINLLDAKGTGELIINPVPVPVIEIKPEINVNANGSEHNGEGSVAKGSIPLTFVNFENVQGLSAAILKNIPEGFTVYYGNDVSSAKMAKNSGDGMWSIPVSSNTLPPFISIKPPAYWSGKLEDLQFSILSLNADSQKIVTDTKFDFTVFPIADGIKEFVPTYSFNQAGSLFAVLNLNIGLKDPLASLSSGEKDQFSEVADVTLKGFKDLSAVFKANGNVIAQDRIEVVDNKDGTYSYKLIGLSQTELNKLEISHKNTNGTLTIKAEAYTYEVNSDGQRPLDENGDFLSNQSGSVNSSFQFQIKGIPEPKVSGRFILNNDVDDMTSLDSQVIALSKDQLFVGDVGQDVFVWDLASIDGSTDRIQNFDTNEQDQLDVSQLLKDLGWNGQGQLSDYIHYTQSGDDAQLNIQHDDKAVSIVIENNTWNDLSDMISKGNLKTDI